MSGYDRALLAAAIRRGHTDRVAGQIAQAIDTALEHERQYAHLDSRITEAISLLDAAWQVVQAYRTDLDRTSRGPVSPTVEVPVPAVATDRPGDGRDTLAPSSVDRAYAHWMHLVDSQAPACEIAAAHARWAAMSAHPSNQAVI
jgi:hypothetical protein